MKDDLYSLEILIARLLRFGVVIAGVLIFMGWIFQLDFSAPAPFESLQHYQPTPLLKTLQRARTDRHWAELTAYVGLMVLISLPLLRVLLTGAVFIKQKDYVLAAVTALVFSGLMLSFMLGFEI